MPCTDRPLPQVFDLEHRPGPYDARLERIEAMLERLLESEPRPSDLTYVEPSRRKGVASHHDSSPTGAPGTGHGMAAQSVAAPPSDVPANGVHGHGHGQSAGYAQGNAGMTGSNLAGRPHAELGPPQ